MLSGEHFYQESVVRRDHFRYYKLSEPPAGDFLVDEKYLLEVGGKSKSFKQIADIPDSFVVVDDEETALGCKIPMWIFGFLY